MKKILKKDQKRRREAKFLSKLRKSVENSLDECALYKQGKKKLKTIQEVLDEI